MAITRRWQGGADNRALSTANNPDYTGSNGSTTITTGAGRTGLAYEVNVFTTNSFYQDIPDTAQVRVGFAFQADVWPSGDGDICVIHDGATRLAEVELVIATGDLRLKILTAQEDITVTAPIAIDTWYHIGIDVKIDGAAGWVKVYLNQVEVLAFAGNTGAVNIDRIRFGTLTDTGATGVIDYDDVYIDDSAGEGAPAAVADKKFAWIEPNATGNYAEWIGSDGNNVNNYLLVDEQPPVTADYVEEDTVDEFDSYEMTTHVIGAGEEVIAVIPIAWAQRYGALEELAVGTRFGGVDAIGADQDPGAGAWTYLWERQITKPGGGAWDQAAIDDVELVLKSRGAF